MTADRTRRPGAAKAAGRDGVAARVREAQLRFVAWLERYGETSFDHQSYFAGSIGGRAKALYYRRPLLGTLAVAPMIFSEAFVPAARRLFGHRLRFPIADAHYAAGFAMLYRCTGDRPYLQRAQHFAEVLASTRCPGYERAAWGYPFDWVTVTGVMPAQTPLITTTPYAYEAFAELRTLDGDARWTKLMRSSAEHALRDIPDRTLSPGIASAGYHPADRQACVVNASAYRAGLLMSAAIEFGRDDYRCAAQRNLAYVIGAQHADGSWPYATDGLRPFVDHFHTCFVLKALARIHALTGDERVADTIEKGVRHYTAQLFDAEGLPRPFARAPRLVVYRRELYDYAECINLATLLRGRFPALDERLATTLDDLLAHWQKRDGSFRTRRLLAGWDEVPMHRWAQAQLFRSLSQWLLAARHDAHDADFPAGTAARPSAAAAALA